MQGQEARYKNTLYEATRLSVMPTCTNWSREQHRQHLSDNSFLCSSALFVPLPLLDFHGSMARKRAKHIGGGAAYARSGTKAAGVRSCVADEVWQAIRKQDVQMAERLAQKAASVPAEVVQLVELCARCSGAAVAERTLRAAASALGAPPLSAVQLLRPFLALAHSTMPEEAAAFVDSVFGPTLCTDWGSGDGATRRRFFQPRARQCALEFFEDMQVARERARHDPPDNLVAEGRVMLNLMLQPGRRPDEVVCSGADNVGMSRRGLQRGDAVGLSRMGADGSLATLVEAEVIATRPLVAKLPLESEVASLLAEGGEWRMDRLANRQQFVRQINAMHVVATGSPETHAPSAPILRVLTHPDTHSPIVRAVASTLVEGVTVNSNIQLQKTLNQSQQRALSAASVRCLSLLQGPPGTGKTTVAVHLLKRWAALGERVLATSDSNIAVDNLVDGLAAAGVRCVRLGRPDSSGSQKVSSEHSADVIAAKSLGVSSLGEVLDRESAQEAVRNTIQCAEVVCCTCVAAGGGILDGYVFTKVLVDEAAQATEPSTLVPLCHSSRQLVLVGDQCQLPPTVVSNQAAKAGLSLSLFDRLVHAGVDVQMLEVQYRMHPAIASFPSRWFYGGRLQDGITADVRIPVRGFTWARAGWPVTFFGIEGREESSGTSKENRAEVEKVCAVVSGILKAGDLSPVDIGVVTPYAAQARKLRRELQGRGVEVSSIDGFQGREKDLIIMSTVRASSHGGLGFVADWRRMNVALTRARRGIIVVGHPTTLARDDETWGPWLQWIQRERLYLGAAIPRDLSPLSHPPDWEARALEEFQRARSPLRFCEANSKSAVPSFPSICAAHGSRPPSTQIASNSLHSFSEEFGRAEKPPDPTADVLAQLREDRRSAKIARKNAKKDAKHAQKLLKKARREDKRDKKRRKRERSNERKSKRRKRCNSESPPSSSSSTTSISVSSD